MTPPLVLQHALGWDPIHEKLILCFGAELGAFSYQLNCYQEKLMNSSNKIFTVLYLRRYDIHHFSTQLNDIFQNYHLINIDIQQNDIQ